MKCFIVIMHMTRSKIKNNQPNGMPTLEQKFADLQESFWCFGHTKYLCCYPPSIQTQLGLWEPISGVWFVSEVSSNKCKLFHSSGFPTAFWYQTKWHELEPCILSSHKSGNKRKLLLQASVQTIAGFFLDRGQFRHRTKQWAWPKTVSPTG